MTARAGLGVACQRITHLYQSGTERVVALRDVDLVIPAGSSLALLGPSGSGKSTLMSLLAGLQRPTTGQLLIGDIDISGDRHAGRRLRAAGVALLLQEPSRALLPYLTPLLALRRAGDPDPVASLTEFGLDHVAHRASRELSSGEQQRLAFAVVLARRPGLLLVDEPTSRLDIAERDIVIDALHRAATRSGATLIVVTHDPAVASSFSRTLTMRDGRIGAEGRDGAEVAVVGADGAITLNARALEMLPPGHLASVEITSLGVLLRPSGHGRAS
jgi:putative ABC transport system ATP-binding protein